jgi:hypothetical protein
MALLNAKAATAAVEMGSLMEFSGGDGTMSAFCRPRDRAVIGQMMIRRKTDADIGDRTRFLKAERQRAIAEITIEHRCRVMPLPMRGID